MKYMDKSRLLFRVLNKTNEYILAVVQYITIEAILDFLPLLHLADNSLIKFVLFLYFEYIINI